MALGWNLRGADSYCGTAGMGRGGFEAILMAHVREVSSHGLEVDQRGLNVYTQGLCIRQPKPENWKVHHHK